MHVHVENFGAQPGHNLQRRRVIQLHRRWLPPVLRLHLLHQFGKPALVTDVDRRAYRWMIHRLHQAHEILYRGGKSGLHRDLHPELLRLVAPPANRLDILGFARSPRLVFEGLRVQHGHPCSQVGRALERRVNRPNRLLPLRGVLAHPVQARVRQVGCNALKGPQGRPEFCPFAGRQLVEPESRKHLRGRLYAAHRVNLDHRKFELPDQINGLIHPVSAHCRIGAQQPLTAGTERGARQRACE